MKKKGKKIIALTLSLMMMCTLAPTAALAVLNDDNAVQSTGTTNEDEIEDSSTEEETTADKTETATDDNEDEDDSDNMLQNAIEAITELFDDTDDISDEDANEEGRSDVEEESEASGEKQTKTVYEYSDDDISVIVTLDDANDIPDEAVLIAERLDESSEEYIRCKEAAEEEILRQMCANGTYSVTMTEELYTGELEDLIAYDISLSLDGEEIEPEDTVSVRIEYSEELLEETGMDAEDISIVHVDDSDNAEAIETGADDGVISFETDSFSSYAAYTVTFGSKFNGSVTVFDVGNTHYCYQYLNGYVAFCGSLGLSSTSGSAAYIGTTTGVWGSTIATYINKAFTWYLASDKDDYDHALAQTYI